MIYFDHSHNMNYISNMKIAAATSTRSALRSQDIWRMYFLKFAKLSAFYGSESAL